MIEQNADLNTKKIISHESEECEQFISFLNEEISQIQKDEDRPGWTIGALIVGLASCIWLLIDQFEKNITKWNVVSIMLIAITLTLISIKSIIGLLSTKSSNLKNDRLISIKDIFSSSRLTIILLFPWSGMICYLVAKSNVNIPTWEYSLTYISLGFLIFASIISILMSANQFFIMPYGITSKEIVKGKVFNVAIIFSLLFVVINLISAYAWFNYIIVAGIFSIHELKISSLIIAISILFLLTTALKSSTPTLKDLIKLRRELILGVMPIEQIKRQVDFTLRGRTVEDYFFSETANILSFMQSFDKELFLASQKIMLFYNSELNSKEDIQLKLRTQEVLKESIMHHLVSSANIKFHEINLLIKKLKRKKKLVSLLLSKDVKFEILDEIFGSINISVDNYNSLVKKWHNTLSEVSGLESAASMIKELMKQVPQLDFDPSTGT